MLIRKLNAHESLYLINNVVFDQLSIHPFMRKPREPPSKMLK